MGSFAGAAPTPMLTVYSASKSFLRTWSEGLAAELVPKGVIVEHVNTYYVVRSPLSLTRITQNIVGFYDIKTDHDVVVAVFVVADFGNVENPPIVDVHSHFKSLCARRPRQDRAGHYHAFLDPCTSGRGHGACTI